MPATCENHFSDRLLLRQWKDSDRQIFHAINNDADVMRYFPRTFTYEESDAFINKSISNIAKFGWGSWAVELIDSGEFIGFVGFSEPADWHPCAGNLEIGWRLGRKYWGHGYATEAAICAMQVGFNTLGFEDVVSFTSACNLPSINVMKKLGMKEDNVGFIHPRIDLASHLAKHVVFRISKSEWQTKFG